MIVTGLLAVMGGVSAAAVIGCMAFAGDRWHLKRKNLNLQQEVKNYQEYTENMQKQMQAAGIGGGGPLGQVFSGSMAPEMPWAEYVGTHFFREIESEDGATYIGIDDNNNVTLVLRRADGYGNVKWVGSAIKDANINDLIEAVM